MPEGKITFVLRRGNRDNQMHWLQTIQASLIIESLRLEKTSKIIQSNCQQEERQQPHWKDCQRLSQLACIHPQGENVFSSYTLENSTSSYRVHPSSSDFALISGCKFHKTKGCSHAKVFFIRNYFDCWCQSDPYWTLTYF